MTISIPHVVYPVKGTIFGGEASYLLNPVEGNQLHPSSNSFIAILVIHSY